MYAHVVLVPKGSGPAVAFVPILRSQPYPRLVAAQPTAALKRAAFERSLMGITYSRLTAYHKCSEP